MRSDYDFPKRPLHISVPYFGAITIGAMFFILLSEVMLKNTFLNNPTSHGETQEDKQTRMYSTAIKENQRSLRFWSSREAVFYKEHKRYGTMAEIGPSAAGKKNDPQSSSKCAKALNSAQVSIPECAPLPTLRVTESGQGYWVVVTAINGQATCAISVTPANWFPESQCAHN